jgi:hypothetical protein
VLEPREVSFRSQQDFRRQLITALVAKSRESEICPKRRISRISGGADQVPVREHKQVKLGRRGPCVNCKGLRFKDRLKKRLPLSQIAANQGRSSSRHDSCYRCEQCDVPLCKERGCFDVFHS